jgi:hypothetical protein
MHHAHRRKNPKKMHLLAEPTFATTFDRLAKSLSRMLGRHRDFIAGMRESSISRCTAGSQRLVLSHQSECDWPGSFLRYFQGGAIARSNCGAPCN